MALITCPECGQQVSDTAKSCPHCGFVLRKTVNINLNDGALMAGNAMKSLKGMRFDNPFETISFNKWKSAFASRKFLLYLIVVLVVLAMTIISKGIGYSLLFIIPLLIILLRAVAEGIIDKDYPDTNRSFKTLMQYDDLVMLMLVLPFKGTVQIILLAIAASLSVVALMKMAAFMRNATASRTCPECGHTIEAGQQECAYCSYVDVPNNISSSKSHYVAAVICFAVLLVGGMLLHKPLPSKCERLEANLAAFYEQNRQNAVQDAENEKTMWQCSQCGQQVFGSSYPSVQSKCPGDYAGIHSWKKIK